MPKKIKSKRNYIIFGLVLMGILIGLLLGYVIGLEKGLGQIKPPKGEENFLSCDSDVDCVCYNGCGCVNKDFAGKVYCIQIVQPCETGEEVCRCIEGQCESVKK